MRKAVVLLTMSILLFSAQAQLSLKAPAVKWNQNYSFDQCNTFKMEAYAKNNELMRTFQLMTTITLQNPEKYTVDLSGADMNTAINKVNYYTF